MAGQLNLREVHQYKKINLPDGRTITKLAKVDAYIRLGEGDGILYIQAGQVFSEAGPPIPLNELPGWFWNQLGYCSNESLVEAGWQLGNDAEVIKKALKAQQEAAIEAAAAAEAVVDEATEPVPTGEVKETLEAAVEVVTEQTPLKAAKKTNTKKK